MDRFAPLAARPTFLPAQTTQAQTPTASIASDQVGRNRPELRPPETTVSETASRTTWNAGWLNANGDRNPYSPL
jgi:hypothetical protein